MSSTYFEPEGSSLGKRLYIHLWYSRLLTILMHVKHTITAYTIVFLKMNHRVRNMQKTKKIKNENTNLWNVHFFGLYGRIT
jgi:hypothetical protein